MAKVIVYHMPVHGFAMLRFDAERPMDSIHGIIQNCILRIYFSRCSGKRDCTGCIS